MREKIREAIFRAAREASGYDALDTKTGFTVYLQNGATPIGLPFLWLCPLELTHKNGRTDGMKTYAGVMYLAEDINGLDPARKDERWDHMEETAERILNAAAESEDIVSVENIRCFPDEYALTGYQTISSKVAFDINVNYCADRE